MADEAAADCLFERLRLHQQRAPDSTEVARAITARINARLTSHGKIRLDIIGTMIVICRSHDSDSEVIVLRHFE